MVGLARSEYLADLLALHVDRPDLVRHNDIALPQTSPPATDHDHDEDESGLDGDPHTTTIRVHPDVADEIQNRAAQLAIHRGTYITYVVSEHCQLPTPSLTKPQEVLPLAM